MVQYLINGPEFQHNLDIISQLCVPYFETQAREWMRRESEPCLKSMSNYILLHTNIKEK